MHVDLVRSGPPHPLDLERLHLGRGDQAAVDGLDIVRAVPPQPDAPVTVHREADTGPPRQPDRCARYLLDDHLGIDGGDAPKLLGHELGLQAALGGEVDVLPVAASAASGSGVGTGWFHPIGRGLEDLDRVGSEERGGLGGDGGDDPLAGKGVTNEHDPSVVGPSHAAAAGGDGTGVEFDTEPWSRSW